MGYIPYNMGATTPRGCCTHVITILWYLGYDEHFLTIPASFLDDVTVTVENSDSSDEDEN